jgi:hypothetical protein
MKLIRDESGSESKIAVLWVRSLISLRITPSPSEMDLKRSVRVLADMLREAFRSPLPTPSRNLRDIISLRIQRSVTQQGRAGPGRCNCEHLE